MAYQKKRGVSIDEQIRQVEADIEIVEKKWNDLKAKLDDLEEKKKQQEMEELYKLVYSSGKSIEEIKTILMEQK